jgi:hypothetical protein
MAVTAITLWNRALDYADMTGSSFPDTNRKYDLINVGLSELYYTLVHSNAEYFVATPSSISVVSGTALYNLPADFYKALKLYYVQGDRRYIVRPFSREQVQGLLATPSTSATLELHYVPTLTLVTADNDQINAAFPPGWEDYVALHVAIRLLMREESFEQVGALRTERDRLITTITQMASPRDVHESLPLTDVYGRWRDPWRDVIGGPGASELFYRIEGTKLRFIETDPIAEW